MRNLFLSFLFQAVMVAFCYPSAKFFLFILKKRGSFPKVSNFNSEIVPTGFGILFCFNLFLIVIFFILSPSIKDFRYRKTVLFEDVSFYAELSLIMLGLPLFVSLIGYLDDVRGQKDIKGLTKNIKSLLFSGRITSSLLKLFVVVICAFLWSVYYETEFMKKFLLDILLDVFLIVLFTNFLNLLDLRPGRAIKTSIFLFLPLSFCQDINPLLFNAMLMIAPVLAAVLAYAPLDFRGQAMMGDAGSNMLGFVLGIGYAVILPLPAKIAVVLLLTLFHIYCEFYSFSDFISRNRVLRWLDEWGTCMRKDRV